MRSKKMVGGLRVEGSPAVGLTALFILDDGEEVLIAVLTPQFAQVEAVRAAFDAFARQASVLMIEAAVADHGGTLEGLEVIEDVIGATKGGA